MNDVETLYRQIMALRTHTLVTLTGETDCDSEHLHRCAEHLQDAMDELEGVETI